MSEYFLQHHGIKGQKWGVKHGPPYPLTGKNAERAKKAFKKRVDKNIGKSFNKAADTFNDRVKEINNKEKYQKLREVTNFTVESKIPLAKYYNLTREYNTEVTKLWQEIFIDQALDDIGTDWVTNGEEWIRNVHHPYVNSALLDAPLLENFTTRNDNGLINLKKFKDTRDGGSHWDTLH